MLIEDGKLNIEVLKNEVLSYKWVKVPRQLNKKIPEYFYVGKYKEGDRLVEISIRPTLWMQVKESLENCDYNTGAYVPEDKRKNKKLVTFGSSVQVLVDELFLEKIKQVCEEPDERNIQKISWS